MVTRNFTLILCIIIQTLWRIHSSIIPPPPPFNLSHFLFPRVTAVHESQLSPQPTHFLQNVLNAIASKERWSLEDIRVSDLKVKKAKYDVVPRYEFRVRVGKSEIVLKMHEQPSEWKKLAVIKKNVSSDFESLVKKIGSHVVIDSFKIEGPFELQVMGDDDQLSIMLPSNTSHSGLRRISVGEGISLEVKSAEEISIFLTSNRNQLLYGSFTYRKGSGVESIWSDSCSALPTIGIMGSASVVAYRDQQPSANIKVVFSSVDAIKLLSNKCYIWPNYEKPKHPSSSLSIRIAFLEGILRSYLNSKAHPISSLGSLKARIRASAIIHFHLELERGIRSNDTYWNTLADWRTRPMVERALYDVAARMEGEILKPMVIKRIRPFIDADSFAWNSLLANLSFTKLPSMLVSPEALTLDVKW
ncbi:protein TUNICAMYCIN INDUCED 1 [Henckelia pumila]|uniref:protein TUNICAMYCIN INDUCED 1 n=1 Tax=Henckelia pumila TaxID=405737 RepID=UPI003C6DD5BF